ncbi:MAG: hypothetical protein R3A51_22245 [Nannocystaceae bacterium]
MNQKKLLGFMKFNENLDMVFSAENERKEYLKMKQIDKGEFELFMVIDEDESETETLKCEYVHWDYEC